MRTSQSSARRTTSVVTATTDSHAYPVRQFNLHGLEGISDRTLELHLKLYEGYVTQTNLLQAKIQELFADGEISEDERPAYSELKRRLGFEYNGMVLHELSFENLKQGGREPTPGSRFVTAAESSFESFDRWRSDFVNVGKLRGVGWAICYLDGSNGRLSNHWVTLHEGGNIAGFKPLLVLDVWEHAYLLDCGPAERGKYIDAFFANVCWDCVERRFPEGSRG